MRARAERKMRKALIDQQIADVYVDANITYIMLMNGTQISIKGTVLVDVSTVKEIKK